MHTEAFSGLRLDVGEDDDALAAELSRALTAYNSEATGVDSARPFSAKINDDGGGLVAGLTGWTWGTCAGISRAWVRADSRRVGLGGRLLTAAEGIAVERGCNRIFVSSPTFQAPYFYRNHGYVETARIKDLLAEGAADIWLVKRLGPVG